MSSRPSLAGTRSLVAALLEYSLTSELQNGEKYEEETGRLGRQQPTGDRMAPAAAGRLRGQAKVCRVLSCQEAPHCVDAWRPF